MRGKPWIFLAPCSDPIAQKHFQDTILNGVRFEDIAEYLKEDDKTALQGKDPLRIWGNTPGSYSQRKGWIDMELGDIVLFYQSGKFTYAGKVYQKIDDERLSKKLWPDKGDKRWNLIYFLQDIRRVDIPLSLIRNYSGYKPGFIAQRFQSMNSQGIEAILQDYGSIENFVKTHEIISPTETNTRLRIALIGSTGSDYVEPRRDFLSTHEAVWSGWDFRIRQKQRDALNEQLSREGIFRVYLHDSTKRGGSGKIRYVGYVDKFLTSDTGIRTPEPDLTTEDERELPSKEFVPKTWLRFFKIEELENLIDTRELKDYYKDTPIAPSSLRNRFAFVVDPAQLPELPQHELIDNKLLAKFAILSTLLEKKKQVILYGPPGTGKTYLAKQFAVWFLTGQAVEEQNTLRKKFEEIQAKELVDLVQFHPAYAYEDFVEGIRPVSTEKGITYVIQPGILKRCCKSAAVSSSEGYFAKVKEYKRIRGSHLTDISLQRYGINKISLEIFSKLLKSIETEQDKIPELFENLSNFKGFYVLRLRPDSPYSDEESKMYHYVPSIPGSRQLSQDLEKGNVAFFYYDRDKGGIFGVGYFEGLEKKKAMPSKSLLIIDEINRGKLAKIFGELIYALEYRGERVKLQYSGSDETLTDEERYLAIPENLYIIGTMNTADRSIALVDVALRRRFCFLECMPDLDFLVRFLDVSDKFSVDALTQKYKQSTSDDEKIKIISILALKNLNEKIVNNVKLGKEKQIGHSYLLSLNENAKDNSVIAWRHNIFPLLEEYFYYDYSQLEDWFGTDLIDRSMGIKEFTLEQMQTSLEKLCNM